jgi:hypothetical protein
MAELLYRDRKLPCGYAELSEYPWGIDAAGLAHWLSDEDFEMLRQFPEEATWTR